MPLPLLGLTIGVGKKMAWRFREVMGGLRHPNMGYFGVACVEEYLRRICCFGAFPAPLFAQLINLMNRFYQT